VAALGSPSHLHERGNRDRNIRHREIAAHERISLEGTRTKDANAAVAQIVKATVKFLWQGTRRLTRQQTPCMHFKHLRETLMLASFSI
jgi:hypothetical protein